jgi:hypothetical protein
VPAVDVQLRLYDKSFQPLGVAGGMVYITAVLGFNQADTGELQLLASDPVNQYLAEPGSRYVLIHAGRVYSGRLIKPRFDVSPAGLVTYQLRGDWSMLDDTLAWVVPENPISPAAFGQIAQAVQVGAAVPNTVAGQSGYFAWDPGLTTAEAALKDIIGRNFARLGRPVRILEDQGRGGDPRAYLPEVRFSTLAEAIAPILTGSGLGVRAWQEVSGNEILVDVWEPDTHPNTLSYRNGSLTAGTAALGYPDLTRAVILGPGEDAARAFSQVADTQLEAEIGYVIEGSRDATSGDLKWPEGLPTEEQVPVWYRNRTDVDGPALDRYLTGEGAKELADGAGESELELTLTESETFRFGDYREGDLVNVSAQGLTWLDRVTTVSLSRSASGEGKITPALGKQPPAAADANLFRLYVRLKQLEKQQRSSAGR